MVQVIKKKVNGKKYFRRMTCLFLGRYVNFSLHGGMAEWSNAAVLKTVRSAMVSRVRIPVPPPEKFHAPLGAMKFFRMRQGI